MELTNVEYIEELKSIKNKMIAAERFAVKFPFFKKQILEGKITGKGFTRFDGYKDIYLGWGICRSYYETAKNLTNYKNKHEDINCFLSRIYINTLTLYNLHDNFGLFDIGDNCEVFYIDYTNSTFYVADEHLESFLETLNSWFLKARVEAKKLVEVERIKRLEDELSKLKKQYKL